jgi:hypothetical protein
MSSCTWSDYAYVLPQIALNIYVALSFCTHVERLNCIVGTRSRRSSYILIGWVITLAKYWLRPDNTTHYLCRTNLAASCDCYVALSFYRTAPVESNRNCRVTHFSQPCRHYPSVVIIEPQLRLLRTLCGFIVYPDYRSTIAPVALVIKACCVVVALMAAHMLTSDTLELVLAWNVVGYSSP